MSTTGQFFHTRQSSEVLPEDRVSLKSKLSKRSKQRSALAERSPSQINKERRGKQPTIRLVDPDPQVPHTVYEKTPFPQLDSQVLNPPKTTKHGYTVQNDGAFSSLDARLRDRSTSPKRSSKLFPQLSLKRSNRMSSSTTTSNAETLINDSALHSPALYSPGLHSPSLYSPTSHRFSVQSTVRNTPTPGLQEERYLRQKEAAIGPLEDPSTIRPVTASSGTTRSNSTDRFLDSRGSNQSFGNTGDERLIHPAFRQIALENRQSRLSDIASVDTRLSEALPRENAKLASSDYSPELGSSTPNVTTVGSYNVIKYAKSDENMSIQYPEVRPPTARSQSAASYTESESLPSLHVARKRQHGYSSSAGPAYNRARPLSTIASESEPATSARAGRRTWLDYGPAETSKPNFSRPRAKTIGSSSHTLETSDTSQLIPEDAEMDLTGFSIIRADSAVPIPLFSESPVREDIYELPGDMPPEETNNEEGDDTIMELKKPRLRKQRSAYGLNVMYNSSRGRATSDPPPGSSHSIQPGTEMADRTSQGSTIFPQWAKAFYKGKFQLASANVSRASLARPDSQPFSTRSPVRMMPWAHHRRFESGWESYATGDTGFTSPRPGTAETRWSGSPGESSYFLPSIFRPANRTRAYTDITFESSHPSDAFYDESDASDRETRRDSMEITPAPPRRADLYAARHPSPLRSGGANSKRSKRSQRQQQHDQGAFTPREPSYQFADPTSRAYSSPHLQPSRRLTNRLSAWRAPSFDEALSTLVKTRQNRQITLFCMGFVCPLFWILAAFLPLPPRPMDSRITEDALKVEGEGRYSAAPDFDWQQETRHLKARWWRHLNRIMSVLGVAVIGAIIALAVVASH